MKKFICAAVSLIVAVSALLPTTLSFAADDTTGEITIMHTNDIHGYYTETSKGILGFAKLKALKDEISADLLVDAGDTFHGQAFATVTQGESIAELMGAVGYDAMTPGNHDFSYGASKLLELEEISGCAVLASNITDSDGEYFDTPYVIKDIDVEGVGDVKVGIVGVIDDAFYSSTAAENVSGLEFSEEAAVATKVAKTLKEENGCDIVIALTHQADPEGFVSNTNGIDAVIAGHEHIFLDETYKNADGEDVKTVEAGYYFYGIGVLTLTVDSNKEITAASEKAYSQTDLENVSADETILEKITEIETEESEILSTVVGQSDGEYSYSWEEIRVDEQDIGHIVTAAYLERTGADVAIENAGGIRSGIPSGDVTYKDIISISPYGNCLVTKEVTGAQLLSIIETSLDIGIECDKVYTIQKEAVEKGEDPYQYSWPSNSGSYLQFGGIKVTYNPDAEKGERVVSVEVGGEALDESKTYTVATNNYIADSEIYPELANADLQKEYGTCEEALIKFVKSSSISEAAANKVYTIYDPDEQQTTETETTEEATTEVETTAEAETTTETSSTTQAETDSTEAQTTTVAAPTTTAANSSAATDKAVNTGAAAGISAGVFMIAGLAAAIAVKKRK